MAEHLNFMGYDISGTELQDFFDFFSDKYGYKPYQSYDGIPYINISPDLFYKYPKRVLYIQPITSIFEEYEALRGRKNIVYGLNIVRRVRNHVLRDENYTKRAWNEYNSLLAMYKYKYGEPIVLYNNKLPEGMELTTKLSRRLHWEDVNSLTNEQRIDMRFLHDYLYSKVVLFSIAGGRIYLGQSYVSDCLNIIYIDNEAQRIADDEYNFVKVI